MPRGQAGFGQKTIFMVTVSRGRGSPLPLGYEGNGEDRKGYSPELLTERPPARELQ